MVHPLADNMYDHDQEQGQLYAKQEQDERNQIQTPSSNNPSQAESDCEHNWSVRERKEMYMYLNGDRKPGYTVYFCTKCLETKTVGDNYDNP